MTEQQPDDFEVVELTPLQPSDHGPFSLYRLEKRGWTTPDALDIVRRRWKIERLFAWLHNFRRLVTRWEYHHANFLGMVHLGCIVILLRHL